MKNDAFEKLMAFLLVKGSDQYKYDTLLKLFVSQFSLKNDQYPKTSTTETDVLSNHILNTKFYNNKREKHSCYKARNDTED